jgi:hypothetical protein
MCIHVVILYSGIIPTRNTLTDDELCVDELCALQDHLDNPPPSAYLFSRLMGLRGYIVGKSREYCSFGIWAT